MGWSTSGPQSALVNNGEYITKPREIAETLSKHFDDKINTLKSNISVKQY